jgi:hypothetical protein
MKWNCLIFLIQAAVFFSPDLFSQENQTDFSYLRETVYTLKPYYIVVNFTTQKGYLYSRTEPVKEFGLSTGTENLEDGVETKPGLYVIQSKKEIWYSRQFDSTLMLNWMGFNWGIGFHALNGNGYYRYLGKKRSSHGCIRLTRAMAKELYNKIDEGTPVLVHNGYSAVTIKFGDPGDAYTYPTYSVMKYLLNKQLKEIYAGQYFVSYRPKLLIDFNNVYHQGLPIGDSRKIPKWQITPPISKYISSSTPEPKGFMILSKPFKKDEVSFIGYRSFR